MLVAAELARIGTRRRHQLGVLAHRLQLLLGAERIRHLDDGGLRGGDVGGDGH